MRQWKNASSLVLCVVLAGCLGETPERARILDARVVRDAGRPELELTQDLRFSRTMREALAHGIALRLVYAIEGCGESAGHVLELRYVPLSRHYELQRLGAVQARSFARRSALLASLDRIRLPLAAEPPVDCHGTVSVVLDLTSLPTPLRFPAFFERAEWRLVSPSVSWPSQPARA